MSESAVWVFPVCVGVLSVSVVINVCVRVCALCMWGVVSVWCVWGS